MSKPRHFAAVRGQELWACCALVGVEKAANEGPERRNRNGDMQMGMLHKHRTDNQHMSLNSTAAQGILRSQSNTQTVDHIASSRSCTSASRRSSASVNGRTSSMNRVLRKLPILVRQRYANLDDFEDVYVAAHYLIVVVGGSLEGTHWARDDAGKFCILQRGLSAAWGDDILVSLQHTVLNR
ncbi:hypothetical protein C8J57DRAFT_1214041 [Mycena rebaudengoi]|nr:hypothetical protein C8J57DRAFT_1214041 [Mycena rebaudengoi]